VTGVDQLNKWIEKRQYREVGNLLEAVNQLSKYFSGYSEIKRITSLVEEGTVLAAALAVLTLLTLSMLLWYL